MTVVAIVPLAAVGCGDDDTTASGTANDDGPIKIGFVTALSGPIAALGEVERNAAELFEEQINDAGGVLGQPLEIVHGDTQSKPELAVTETRRILNEGVSAIVGPANTADMIAAIPVIKGMNIPALFMTPTDYPNLNEEPLLFSPVGPALKLNLSALFPHVQETGKEHIGLILGNDALGDAFVAVSDAALEQAPGLEMSIDRVPVDSQDYTSVLANMRDEGIDAVFTGLTGAASATIRNNAVQIGWDVPMFSHTGNLGQDFLDLMGDDAEGFRWYSTVAPVAEDLPEGEQKELIEGVVSAYEEKFGAPPSDYLALGFAWDNLLSVVDAIESSGSADPEAVRDALETQDIVAINGHAQRSPTDHRGAIPEDAVIVEWNGERYVKVP